MKKNREKTRGFPRGLAAVIRRATRELPKNWSLEITIAGGRASVACGTGSRFVDFDRANMTLAEQIGFCLRVAINHESIRGKDRRLRT